MHRHLARPSAWAPSPVAWILLAISSLLLVALPTPASASLSCTAQTGAVAFGTYKATTVSDNDSTGYVEVKCTCSGLDCIGFTYSIEIDSGASGLVSDRRLRKTGQSSGGLKYQLYRDVGRLLPWGTGTDKQSVLYLLSGFGSYQRTTVFGRITAGQNVAVGDYADSTGVTITY